MKILITGGAGFIGSAVVRHLICETEHDVVNVDKLTYAASPDTVTAVAELPRYAFEHLDVCDGDAMADVFRRHQPDAVMHLAAESHVDRSIDRPDAFVQTNVVGTYRLLEAARAHWSALPPARRDAFRFHHVSTDEVFGSLGESGAFTEGSPYDPSSPYAASKAASDHLVRAWHRTYGLPVVLSNCSNNFGPFQFPEKLIPMMIIKGIGSQPLPIYGDGGHRRDWLYVEDHAVGLLRVLTDGQPGESYNLGAGCELANIDVVRKICDILDDLAPAKDGARQRLIFFVPDRPGHDRRYAIDAAKAGRALGWRPRHDFDDALRGTVRWYLDNRDWWEPLIRERDAGARQGLT